MLIVLRTSRSWFHRFFTHAELTLGYSDDDPQNVVTQWLHSQAMISDLIYMTTILKNSRKLNCLYNFILQDRIYRVLSSNVYCIVVT